MDLKWYGYLREHKLRKLCILKWSRPLGVKLISMDPKSLGYQNKLAIFVGTACDHENKLFYAPRNNDVYIIELEKLIEVNDICLQAHCDDSCM